MINQPISLNDAPNLVLSIMESNINNMIDQTKRLDKHKSLNPLYSIHVDKIQMNLERLQEIIKQTKTML